MLVLLIIINKGMSGRKGQFKQKNANSESRTEPKCVGVGQPVFLRGSAPLSSLEKFPAFCATLLSTEKCKSATNRD